MDTDTIAQIYDDEYAGSYDQRFLLDAWPRQGADFELEVIKSSLAADGRWLDVGCGTGWFLSQLPDVERAGFDLSPAMVAQAKDANPGARFIEERSFLDDDPSQHSQWDLVTCLWQPYNYVDSVADGERLLDNMATWTRPGGAVFIPVVDLEDIRPHVDVPYVVEPDVWGGSIALTSITWTWVEPVTGKTHRHLVAPQAGHFVQHLSRTFAKVEVLRYPTTEPGGVSRKAVLATARRSPDDAGAEAEVVWHTRPAHTNDLASRLAVADAEMRQYMAAVPDGAEPGVPRPSANAQLASELEENERRWTENNQRWEENAQAWKDAEAHTRAETARADAAEAKVGASGGGLAAIPTKTLARATASRLRPDRVLRRLARRR